MKGIVFTEFIEMVESSHGMDTTDILLDLPSLKSGGVYTAIGTYDAVELISMVVCLAEVTEAPIDDLLVGFGDYLFSRFHALFPQMFEGKQNAIAFLESIEGHIHVEVRKLYPDAELPTFDWVMEGERLRLIYSSTRPLAKFALGLIQGCVEHFGGAENIDFRLTGAEDGTAAEFVIG